MDYPGKQCANDLFRLKDGSILPLDSLPLTFSAFSYLLRNMRNFMCVKVEKIVNRLKLAK